MVLSELQKFILREAYVRGSRCQRAHFMNFYKRPSVAEYKIITKSLERLIARGLVIGFGHKTAAKWFTEKVTLTAAGRKLTRSLLGEQQRLPFGARVPASRRAS